MAKKPELRITDAAEEKIPITLDRMAALAIRLMKKRAFSSGQTAKDRTGAKVKDLSEVYGWYKSGTRPYRSDKTRAAATQARRRSGKPGKGPLIRTEGGKKRLGVRSKEADQVLSGGTQKALQVIETSPDSRLLGFSTERARTIAGNLQERNDFMGFPPQEVDGIVDAGAKIAEDIAKSVEIVGGDITLNAST